MKKIKVELIHSVPKKVLKAALQQPYESKFRDKSFEKVAYNIIMNMKHQSEAEFAGYFFNIYGISRLNLIELTRHRIASYSVKSTRFTIQKLITKEETPLRHFVYPPDEKEDKLLTKILTRRNEQFLSDLEMLIKAGYSNDQIKYIIPENLRVNLTLGFNSRALLNFLYLRLGKGDNDPHFEIKHLAGLMLDQVLETETGFLFEGFKDGSIK